MRRLLLCASAVLVLSSCVRKGELDPPEVLRRAVRASEQMTSARYEVTGTIAGTTQGMEGNVDFTLQGALFRESGQLIVSGDIRGAMTRDGAAQNINLNAELITEQGHDLYFFVHALSLDPPHPLVSPSLIASLSEKWWRVPAATPSAPVTVTPDPALLKAQAQVVTVTKDRGLETMNGSEAYHYDVAVDPAKLMAFLKKSAESRGEPFDPAAASAQLSALSATGELWIDEKTFYVRRLSWHVVPSSAQSGQGFSADVRVDFRDHDTVPPLAFPSVTNTFPREAFLQMLLTGSASVLPVEGGSSAQALPGNGQGDGLIERMWQEDRKMASSSSASSSLPGDH